MSVVMVTTKKSETSSSSGPTSTTSATLSTNSVPIQEQNSAINTTTTSTKSTNTAPSTNANTTTTSTSINVAPSFVFEPYDPSTSSEGPSNSNNTSCSGGSALNVGGSMCAVEAHGSRFLLHGDGLHSKRTAADEDGGVVVAGCTGRHHDNKLSILLYGEDTGNGSGGGGGLCTVSPHVIFGRMHSEPERPLPLIEFASLQPPVELQTLANPINHRSCPEISPSETQMQQQEQQLQYAEQHHQYQQYLHQHSFTSSRSGGPTAEPSMSIESTGSGGGGYRSGMYGGGGYTAAAAASYHRCSISSTSTGGYRDRLCASPRVKRHLWHLWPSHARSVLNSRLMTRTVSRESMRLSTHALNSGPPAQTSGSGGGVSSGAGAGGNNKSRTSSCSELQPLMAAERLWLQGRAGQTSGHLERQVSASNGSNYLSQHSLPQHGLPCTASAGHHLVRSAGGNTACCTAAGCLYHLGSSTTQPPSAHLAHHRPSLLENEIAEIAADSMRINGALRQFRQLRKATNASTLSMPVAEKGSFTAANSLEVTADASTPLMNATSDHRTPQQFLSQRSFASNSLDSEKKKSTTIKSGLIKPVGYRLGRRKG